MLPGGLLQEPGRRKRTTRDWIVDATMLAARAGDRRARARRHRGPPLRGRWCSSTCVIGVLCFIPLWWRRKYPFAVALLTIVPGAFSAHGRRPGADRAVQRRAARPRRAIVDLHRARRGRRRSSSRSSIPTRTARRVRRSARGPRSRRSSSRGGCSRARSATCCAPRTSARSAWRPSSAPARRPRARPSGGGSRARCTTCSRTGSRCCPCTRARWSSTRTRRRRRSPRPRA